MTSLTRKSKKIKRKNELLSKQKYLSRKPLKKQKTNNKYNSKNQEFDKEKIEEDDDDTQNESILSSLFSKIGKALSNIL